MEKSVLDPNPLKNKTDSDRLILLLQWNYVNKNIIELWINHSLDPNPVKNKTDSHPWEIFPFQQMEKSGFEYRSELWDADYEDEEDIMEEEIEDEIYKGME